MRETTAVGIILALGVGISLVTRNYLGIAFAALGIPAYLAYTAREQNILAKSRLYDRDLFLMIVISAAVILAFNYFFDPKGGPDNTGAGGSTDSAIRGQAKDQKEGSGGVRGFRFSCSASGHLSFLP